MPHHYFASHAMNWVTADTKVEAHDKLRSVTDPKWVNNCLKAGAPLTFFSCRVPLAATDKYAIEWYSPKVEGLTECGNHLVLYCIKSKWSTMPDPRDDVHKLRGELKALRAKHDVDWGT